MGISAPSLDPERSSAQLLRRLEAQAGGRLPLSLAEGAAEIGPSDRLDDPLGAFWLLPGAVVELSALPGAGALSVAFALALRARTRALADGRPGWLCALDPAGTLSAPGLLHLGVPLDELLVVRPPLDRLLPCATRACRAGGVAAVVVDASADDDPGAHAVPLRRLSLAAEEQGAAVLLVTSSRARRSAPLPCAARALVDAVPGQGMVLRPLRHRHGLPPRVTVASARSVIDVLVDEQAPARPAGPVAQDAPRTALRVTSEHALLQSGGLIDVIDEGGPRPVRALH